MSLMHSVLLNNWLKIAVMKTVNYRLLTLSAIKKPEQ